MNNQLRKLASLLIVMLLSASLAGCWDKRELEQQAFVTSLAIDQGSLDDTFIWTFRIAPPRQLAGGVGSVGGNQPSSTLVSVEAPTLHAALNLLNSFIDRKLNLMHLKVVVVGAELAKKDPLPLRILSRYREIRNNLFVLIAEDKAKDILKLNKPVLEKNPSKFAENLILNTSFTGFAPKTQLLDFVIALESEAIAPTAILVGLNKGMPAHLKASPETVAPYIPGEIPREGDTPFEIMGTAVFKDNHMVGTLTGTENRTMAMANGNYLRSTFSIRDPLEPSKHLAMDVRAGSPPVIKVQLRGNRPLISVELSLEADLLASQSSVDYSDLKNIKILEKLVALKVSKTLKDTVKKTQGMGADVFGFGNKARHLVKTWAEWEQLDWGDLYPKADVQVTVDFSIRRIGLMYQPVRPVK